MLDWRPVVYDPSRRELTVRLLLADAAIPIRGAPP
jgi:hypothetical protein